MQNWCRRVTLKPVEIIFNSLQRNCRQTALRHFQLWRFCAIWCNLVRSIPLLPLFVVTLCHFHLSILHSPFSILYSPFSILHPPSSILHPPSSILHPPSSILHPPSSILHPPSSILHSPFSILHSNLLPTIYLMRAGPSSSGRSGCSLSQVRFRNRSMPLL